MSDTLLVDMFVEDRAHEDFLEAMVRRIADEEEKNVRIRIRSARGGHPRALGEFRAFQLHLRRGAGGVAPDLMIAAIDANCNAFQAARQQIQDAVLPPFAEMCVPACPDPHIERWYLADLQTFHRVVGITPSVPQSKCERDFYKHLLAQAVVDAGHPPTLGGIEFARELAEAMSLYRAGTSEASLKHFVEALRGKFRLL